MLAVSALRSHGMLSSDGSVTVESSNLVTLDGRVQPLLKGEKRTLVYFFAPWCSVCAVSIGSIDGIESEELEVVAVALDYAAIEDVEQFVARHDVNASVLLGNNNLKRQFKIKGYPSYYLINEESEVVARSFGFNTSTGIKVKNWLAD